MMVGGAWGEVISILVIGIALPIAVNHGFEWPWQRAAIEEEQPEREPDEIDEEFEALRQAALRGE